MKTKEELKLYFEKGDTPTQEQFWEWMDSYWHKEEKISSDSIDLLATEQHLMYSLTDSTELLGVAKTIVIPEGVKVISSSSFTFNNFAKNYITKVIFPGTLEKIKESAFNNQYLKGILKIPGSCKTIESFAFYGFSNQITELVLEEGIENIGNGAFGLQSSYELKDIYIPNSVKSVDEYAFSIPSLLTVSAPSGLDLSKAGIPATAVITYRGLSNKSI
jgi:hypothetical protein